VKQNRSDHHIHPSIRRRIGAAAEISLLAGTFASIWISVCWVLVGALLTNK
jgi:hypothetical protein